MAKPPDGQARILLPAHHAHRAYWRWLVGLASVAEHPGSRQLSVATLAAAHLTIRKRCWGTLVGSERHVSKLAYSLAFAHSLKWWYKTNSALHGVENRRSPTGQNSAPGCRGRCSTQGDLSRNKRGAKSARLRRQTIQVCAPGVSISVCWIPLDLSHSRNLRLASMRWSLVPQATQSRLSCESAFESSAGKALSKSSPSPPELKAPTQAKTIDVV